MTDRNIESLGDLHDALSSDVTSEIGKVADRVAAAEKRIGDVQADLAEARESNPFYVEGYEKTGEAEKDFSILRAIRGWTSNWNVDDPKEYPERDLVMEATTKANNAGVDTAGGFMVPGQFMDDMIPLLEAKSVLVSLGASVVDGLVGSPVTWPKVTGTATAYWVDEGAAITESQLAFGQLSLQPHGLAALVPMTNRLVRQTSGKVEQVVRERIATSLALKMDLAGLKGTGASGEPIGIVNTSGIGSNDYTSLDLLGDDQTVTTELENHIGVVEDANALDGRLGWAMNGTMKRYFRNALDADGRPLLFGRQDGSGGPQDSFYGYPFAISNQLANTDLIFGNFADLLIAQWGGLLIDASTEAGDSFSKQETLIRASMEVDFGVQHAGSFAIANNLTAS